MTRQSGFGKFNIAGKWQRGYRGQAPAEPWYILTSFGDLETTIRAYSQRFDIEEMFRDFKSGGDHLEGCRLASERLDKLLVIVAIADTSALLQGRAIKRLGIQKYVARPEQRRSKSRRHSAFYVGQQVHHWVQLRHCCQDILAELCQINRRCLQFYLKGERAIELALSTF